MYARINLGFLLLHLKEPAEALVHSSRAVATKPGYCEAHFLRGQALLAHHTGKITSFAKPLLASLAAFEKAITCAGKRVNAEYFLWRGKAWFAKGNIEESLHDLDKAVELDPKYAEAFLLRSDVKKAKGDDWGAAHDRTEGCTLKPKLCPTQLPKR
jgi:tetratricopeptide (TPR) repeat protein